MHTIDRAADTYLEMIVNTTCQFHTTHARMIVARHVYVYTELVMVVTCVSKYIMVRVVFKMAGHKSSQQQIEHLLFGSVSEEELKPLLDRLRGLCDFATTGGVPFTDREIAYKIGMLRSQYY